MNLPIVLLILFLILGMLYLDMPNLDTYIAISRNFILIRIRIIEYCLQVFFKG